MTLQEYEQLQQELSALIPKYKDKHRACSKYGDVYKEAVLHCKSVLSNYKPKENRHDSNT